MADQPAVDGEVSLTERYEQLRRVVLAGHAEGWRHGLGVLTSRGMAGWMTAWQSLPPKPVPALAVGGAVTAPGTGTAEIVNVMAAMALAHV